MKRIVEGFSDLRVNRIRLERRAAQHDERGLWVHYDVDASNDIEYVHGHWQGLVASGLLRAVARERHWPSVHGHTFTIVLPDGTRRLHSESVIGHAFRQAVRQADEDRLLAALRRSSAELGVSMTSVRFAKPLDRPVPQVTVGTDDPGAFVREAGRRISILERPIIRGRGGALAEGLLVSVVSEQGEWVAVSGDSVRVAGGIAVTNPKFD